MLSAASIALPVHSDEFAGKVAGGEQRLIDALGLCGEVQVQTADHNARVHHVGWMQPDKVLPINGQQRTILRSGELQNVFVRNGCRYSPTHEE